MLAYSNDFQIDFVFFKTNKLCCCVRSRSREEADCIVEGVLATEVSFIALNTLELVVQVLDTSKSSPYTIWIVWIDPAICWIPGLVRLRWRRCPTVYFQIVQSSDSLQSLLSFILRVLLHLLSLNQSSLVLQSIFATQRSLVAKVCFDHLIFEAC